MTLREKARRKEKTQKFESKAQKMCDCNYYACGNDDSNIRYCIQRIGEGNHNYGNKRICGEQMKQKSVKTRSESVEGALEEHGVNVSDTDKINVSTESLLRIMKYCYQAW